jgi:hypothetical protein
MADEQAVNPTAVNPTGDLEGVLTGTSTPPSERSFQDPLISNTTQGSSDTRSSPETPETTVGKLEAEVQ